MANYLSNLIDRINQQADVVQPRPVSIYELTDAAHGSPEFGSEPVPDGSIKTTDEKRGQMKEISQMRRRLPGDTAEASELPTAAAYEDQGKPPGTGDKPAALGYLAHRSSASLEGESAVSPPGPENLLPRTVDGRVIAGQPGEKIPSEATANGYLQPEKQMDSTQLQPRLSIQSKKSKPPAVQNTNQILPHMTRQNPREEKLSEKSPEINVTIGRIDVRAVSPAKPDKPKKAIRSTPAMSLDEYLKTRDQEDPS